MTPTEKARARSILKSTYSGDLLRESLAAIDGEFTNPFAAQIKQARRRFRDAVWRSSKVRLGISKLKCSDDARRQALANGRRYRLDCLNQAKFFRDQWFDLRRQEARIEYGEAA